MLSEKCVICDGRLTFLGENGRFKIYKCSSCGLGVTEGNTERDYHQYHKDFVYTKENAQFKNIFKKRATLILQFKKIGKVLEAGSSTGILLSILKSKGWEVLGIEPSQQAQKVAAEQGISTLRTTFEKVQLPSKQFDLVIFNHVLEHLDDPFGMIKKANRILKKDGILFIDVPNFGSLSASIANAKWQYVLPNEHKWHFTYKSLEALLGEIDFKIVHWEATSGIWDYANPSQELWQSFIGFKKRFFKNLFTAIPSWFMTQLKLGTGLTIVARKNSIHA